MTHDLVSLIEGFPGRSWWHRSHVFATVLAFSPNTVAALACLFITEVHIGWLGALIPMHSTVLGKVTDIVAVCYGHFMTCFYVLPLIVVSLTYGVVGGFTIAYAIFRDVCTFPIRLYNGNLNAIWIAIPICLALFLRTLLNIGIIVGQACIFEKWHPDLARHIREEGSRVDSLKVRMPSSVPANVIGCARELAMTSAQVELSEAVNTKNIKDDLLQESGQVHDIDDKDLGLKAEKCILNDEMLAWSCYMKVSLCVSLPFLQLAVVIAARIFGGGGMWESALSTFAERTWAHYFENLKGVNAGGLLKLIWYYI